jgi:hypothetical protein
MGQFESLRANSAAGNSWGRNFYHTAVARCSGLAEVDQGSSLIVPGDLQDSTIPGWDNVWVDLGGEG